MLSKEKQLLSEKMETKLMEINENEKEKCTLMVELSKIKDEEKTWKDQLAKVKKEKKLFKCQLDEFSKSSEISQYILTDDNDKTLAWLEDLKMNKPLDEQVIELTQAVKLNSSKIKEIKSDKEKFGDEIQKKEKKIITLTIKLEDLDSQNKLLKKDIAILKETEAKYCKLYFYYQEGKEGE